MLSGVYSSPWCDKGITVQQTAQMVDGNCRKKDYYSVLRFSRQVKSRMWRPVQFKVHKTTCFREYVEERNSGRHRWTSAYTGVQTASLLIFDGTHNASLPAAGIYDYVRARGIFRRHSDLRHFGAVKKVMAGMVRWKRADDMGVLTSLRGT